MNLIPLLLLGHIDNSPTAFVHLPTHLSQEPIQGGTPENLPAMQARKWDKPFLCSLLFSNLYPQFYSQFCIRQSAWVSTSCLPLFSGIFADHGVTPNIILSWASSQLPCSSSAAFHHVNSQYRETPGTSLPDPWQYLDWSQKHFLLGNP